MEKKYRIRGKKSIYAFYLPSDHEIMLSPMTLHAKASGFINFNVSYFLPPRYMNMNELHSIVRKITKHFSMPKFI